MKKIIKEIVMMLFIFSIALGISLYVKLETGDELWNFQNIYKMYNGYEIYKDANVICTPLFFYIGLVFFKLFGANILIYRIYHSIIVAIYFFTIYKILERLKVEKYIRLLITLFFFIYGNFLIIKIMGNYNILAMLFVNVGAYELLKKAKLERKEIVLQSAITIIIFLVKQNIGIYYAFSILLVIYFTQKKYMINYILGIFIGMICFIIWLISTKHFAGFLDFAILGIKQFANKNLSGKWGLLILGINIAIINLAVVWYVDKKSEIKLEKEKVINLKKLNLISISQLPIMYPIFNESHFILSIELEIITLLYLIIMLFEIKENKRIKSFTIIITIGIMFLSCVYYYNWNKYRRKQPELEYENPFFGVMGVEEYNENVQKYIIDKEKEGKNVILFGEDAALYMVPLKKSNGYFDLPFYGNFGNRSEKEVFKEIQGTRNGLILLKKNEFISHEQESQFIKEKIREKNKKIDEIGKFEVYEIKEK